MSFDNEDPEISRVFEQKVDRRFQRDFGRFIQHQSNGRGDEHHHRQHRRPSHQQQIDQMTVKLIEANESIASLRRQLESRGEEVERMRRLESAANERAAEAQKEAVRWQAEAERGLKRVSSARNVSQSENGAVDKLLLDDYRSALSKYRTWSTFAQKQLQTMKMLLEECGGWTEKNRYKIYFSYRGLKHEQISNETVPDLATGSTIGSYFGAIEDVENISATVVHTKFHTVQTQTDSNNNVGGEQTERQRRLSPLDSSFCILGAAVYDEDHRQQQQHQGDHRASAFGVLNDGEATPVTAAATSMTAQELRLLDCERDIERLEIECAKQHEQIIILSERAKQVELLEEQKADLQMQTDILRRQNGQLIRDHEELKCLFGGGAISRNSLEELVRNAGQLREKNKELETKLQRMEAQLQRETPTVGESRRIAQLFKRKYEADIDELRTKLQKYEPSNASNTTRIWRFSTANPLDEARDELVIREVAAAAISTGTATSTNPLKRRKLDTSAGGDDGAMGKGRKLLDQGGAHPLGGSGEEGVQQQSLEEEDDEGEDNGLDNGRMHNLRVQIHALKHQLQQTESVNAEVLRDFRETVSLLSGYDVRIGEEGFFEAENVHSKNCVFLFQKHGQEPPTVDLLDNECAQRWKDMISNYLVRYNSVPAFLSAVTISLVESPEDFVSSSQPSQQSTSSDAQQQF